MDRIQRTTGRLILQHIVEIAERLNFHRSATTIPTSSIPNSDRLTAFRLAKLSRLCFALILPLMLVACGQETEPGSSQTPTISLSKPGEDASLPIGDLLVEGSITDDAGGVSVTVSLDGTHSVTATGYPAFSATIPAAWLTVGAHTVTASALDADNLTTSVSHHFSIIDETPPEIVISTPADGATLAPGMISISGAVSDDVEPTGVTISIDGATAADVTGLANWNYNWDATDAAPGSHTIVATARDAANNESQASIEVRLNGTTDAYGVLNILSQSSNVDEDVGSVSFIVERSGGTDGAVSVEWTTQQQTALDQEDYLGDNAVFSWADGEGGQKQVSIPIIDDAVSEPAEYFNFLIQNPQGGAALGASTNISVTINANDATERTGVDDWPVDGQIHTPISRATFVPFQRISSATRLGVQAWSKNGIDRVEFAISGGGYSGTNPLVSYARNFNPDSGVYDEFFVTIDPADFSSDGVMTITPTVFGRDGGTRNLAAHSMIMNQSGSLERHEAWVEKVINGGSDSSGKVDDPNHPFESIPAAIAAIYAAYGERCDGGIVWLGEGNWSADTAVDNTTTNEWLTIARNPMASRENVVFNTRNALRKSVDTARLHLKGISIGRTSTDQNGYTLPNIASNIWLDNCLVTGNGVTYKGGDYTNGHVYIDPIQPRAAAIYSTASEYTHSYRALAYPILSVNDYIHDICEDAYQLGLCVIQPRVDHLDATTFSDLQGRHPHGDLFQMHAQGAQNNPDNVILYGFNATNLGYQGFFWRPSSVSGNHADNIAIINNLVYLPETAYFSSFQGVYNHFLLWNNTFAGFARTSFYNDTTTHEFGFTNSSLVGNYFYALEVSAGGTSGYSGTFEAGNSSNNEAISNHYFLSRLDGYGSIVNTGSPDTGSSTATVGTQEIEESDLVHFVNLGRPSNGDSILIDRLSHNRTSFDVHGHARDAASDVGAWEYLE